MKDVLDRIMIIGLFGFIGWLAYKWEMGFVLIAWVIPIVMWSSLDDDTDKK